METGVHIFQDRPCLQLNDSYCRKVDGSIAILPLCAQCDSIRDPLPPASDDEPEPDSEDDPAVLSPDASDHLCRFVGLRLLHYTVTFGTGQKSDEPRGSNPNLAPGDLFAVIQKKGFYGGFSFPSLEGAQPHTVSVAGIRWFESPERHPQSLRFIMDRLAPVLHPVVAQSINFIEEHQAEVVSRRKEMDVLSTCDYCLACLFSCSRLCQCCGYELCLTCYDDVIRSKCGSLQLGCPNHKRKGKKRKATPTSSDASASPSKSRGMRCSHRGTHTCSSFLPVSRLSLGELHDVRSALKKHLPRDSPLTDLGDDDESQCQNDSSEPDFLTVLEKDYNEYSGYQFHDFWGTWERGEPLVIRNLPIDQELWTPTFLSEHYGDELCCISACNKKVPLELMPLGDFFASFGKLNHPIRAEDGPKKLKDFPPNDTFKNRLPIHHKNFLEVLPFPFTTRPDGLFNLASMFPEDCGTSIPDLGPKFYVAHANSTSEGSNGSTRFHGDLADAVNILLYSEPAKKEGEKEGKADEGAIWDVFRARDRDAVKKFLSTRFKDSSDTMHCQQYYLNDTLLKDLRKTTGIRTYRIVQRTGDAVFIPAGCGHQVSNISDCIKAAVDFISIQNVKRCEEIAYEVHAHNRQPIWKTPWKTDLLQLHSLLWFAWKACEHQTHLLELDE